MNLDATLYPDRPEAPADLPTEADKADYVHRVCTAWDFGVPPTPGTVVLLAGWKDVFDRFTVPHSPGFHALRDWYGWEPVPRLPVFGRPMWQRLDALEDREDPCEMTV